MQCRVLLLRAREGPMYLYRGREDPTQTSQDEVEEEEVRRCIGALTGLEDDSVPMKVVMEPFCLGVPSSEVNFLLTVLFGHER